MKDRAGLAVAQLDELTDGGHDLYASIEEMCEANGVRSDEARFKDGQAGAPLLPFAAARGKLK